MASRGLRLSVDKCWSGHCYCALELEFHNDAIHIDILARALQALSDPYCQSTCVSVCPQL